MKDYLGKLGTKHLFKLVSGEKIGFFEALWMRIIHKIIRILDITLTN